MGRLVKITEGKSRHSLSQEVDFINKSLTKVNKAKLKEGRYASIDDELNAIENGGWDAFDNSDLADPSMAARIHQNASFEGRSDLDYVNHEELLDDIEDDFAYEIEDGGNVNYAETPFSGFKDIFDGMKAELDANGEVDGSYGGTLTNAEDLVSYVLEMEIDAIYEEWGIRLPSFSNYPYTSMEDALKHLAPYANDNYPNCKGFFETLMNISKEYNATVAELNLEWPPLIRIPDQAGSLTESKRKTSKKALKEHYDVSTVEGLAKYAKDLASSVLDGKLYDSNAVLAICSTLHCNEDYAAECLDSWIETEQIRRSNLHMVPESKKVTKKRVRESAKLYDVLILFENDGEDELFMNAAEDLAPKGLYDGVSIWSDNHGAVQIYHVDIAKVNAFIEAAYDASFLSQIGCGMPREVRVYPEGELVKLFA